MKNGYQTDTQQQENLTRNSDMKVKLQHKGEVNPKRGFRRYRRL